MLFALIMTLLTGGMRTAARSAAWSDSLIERSTELRLAQTVLRARLSEAYPLFVNRPRERVRIGFDGGPSAVDFISFVPSDLGLGGLYRMQLAWTGTAESGDLVLTQQRIAVGSDGPRAVAEPESRVLVSDARKIRLAYFAVPEGDREPRWQPTWSQTDVLPTLISVVLEFRPGDKREWPEMIVAPVPSATSDCVLQPATRKCRPR